MRSAAAGPKLRIQRVLFQSRYDRRDCVPTRRSKSEGPPGRAKQRGYCAIYGSPSPDRAELPEFEADYVVGGI